MEQTSNTPKNKNLIDSIFAFVFGVVLLVYGIYNHYSGVKVEWKMSPYLFPLLLSVFSIVISIALFFDGQRHQNTADAGQIKYKNFFVVLASVIAYYFLLPKLTFIPSTIALLIFLFRYLGEKRYWLIALLSVVMTMTIYILFGVLLNVMLP